MVVQYLPIEQAWEAVLSRLLDSEQSQDLKRARCIRISHQCDCPVLGSYQAKATRAVLEGIRAYG